MGSLLGRCFCLWLALVAITLGAAGSSFAAGYAVENVGDATQIRGINDSGELTGYFAADPGNQIFPSFFYSTAKGRQAILPGVTSFTFGMGADGSTAGWARVGGLLGPVHAFTWKDGTTTETGAFEGGINSYAYAIGKNGAVVGKAQKKIGTGEDDFIYQAFRYKDGIMQNLGALPGAAGFGSLSDASEVNDLGQAAGSSRIGYQRYSDLHRAVRFETDGTVTDLGTLGGNSSDVSGINNLGQVIGRSEVLDSVPGYTGGDHAFIYNNGALVDLGTFGGPESFAAKINNRGKVVGSAMDSTLPPVDRAFIYTDWTLKNIDTVAGKGSAAEDISDGGRVVGYLKGSDGVSHAFLYTEGSGLVDLNDLLPAGSGWVLNQAYKVNEKGQIAGIGSYGGKTQGFLLTPTASVTDFTMPTAANSLTVPVSSFKAVDSDGTLSYLITESAVVPAANDPGWSSQAPTSYTFSAAGTVTAHAWAKDAKGVISADVGATVAITPPVLTLSAGQPNPHPAGTSVAFSAQAQGAGSYEYRFRLFDGTTWSEATPYGAAAWTLPETTIPGIYTVKVEARAAGSTVPCDASTSLDYRVNAGVAAAPATGVTVATSAPSPQPVGTAVTFTAKGAGSSAYEYRFSLFKFGEWKVVQNYSATDSWTLPGDSPRGNYAVKVEVRGAGSAADIESSATVSHVVCASPANGVVFVEGGQWQAGQELTVEYATSGGSHAFTAQGQGSNAYEYRFKLYDGKAWTEVQPWSIDYFWNFMNPPIGVYTLQVDVRGRGSVSEGEASATMAFRVAASPATSVTLSSDKTTPQPAGTPVTFTAQAKGTTLSTLFEYRFLLNRGGAATEVQPYSSANSWTLPAATPAGSYQVSVEVRGANSAVARDAFKTVGVQLTSASGSDLSVTSFTVSSPVLAGEPSFSSWKLSDLGTSSYNANGTQTNGINSSGQIVGSDYTAFLWDWTGRTDLAMVNATAINEAGQVVGYSPGYNESYAYLYDQGTLTKLTPLTGYPMAAAHAINNNGQIAGSSLAATDMPETRATVWNNGVASALPDLDGKPTYGEALGINDSGDAVGYKVVGRVGGADWGPNHAVLWSKGALIDLSGTCTGTTCGSVARAVNNAGLVVGEYNDSGAVTWINGVPNVMPQLVGTQSSHPLAINNLGQTVGWRNIAGPTGEVQSAVLWDKGAMVDLNTLTDPASGITLVRAEGINDNGEIVGTMSVAGKVEGHHFLLSPVVTLPVPVDAFTATGSQGVTGYILKETSVTPALDDTGWSAGAPSSYSFTGFGVRNLCAFVKDAAGNVSPGVCTKVNVIRNTQPTIGWFTLPAHAGSPTVSITRFTGYSRAGITGYLVSESASAPSAGSAGWSASAPDSFTFAGYGSRTAYAWVKDAAGAISAASSATVSIDTPPSVTAFSMRPLAFGGGSATGGAWSVTNLGKILTASLPVGTNPTLNIGSKAYSIANGISNSGLIAGISFTKIGTGSNRNDVAYWYNGTALDLGYAYYTSTIGKAQGLGANSNGQLVGYARGGSASNQPFKYSLADNASVLVGMPSGALSGYATSINDSGQIVGYSTTANIGTGEFTVGTAFIWNSAGNVKYIPGASVASSRADSISNSGKVAGRTGVLGGSRAFLYDAATDAFSTLGTLGGTSSYAYAVNDAGMVAGYSDTATAGVFHAFLYDGTTMSDLGALGGATKNSTARAINSAGMVVGDSNGHGFIYLNGTMYDLNDLIDPASGITVAYASGINDNGQIVGYGMDTTFTPYTAGNHALLLTPALTAVPGSSLTVPIAKLSATPGNNALDGYLVTESATAPAAADPGWSATPPTSFTFKAYGANTAYAWVKDSTGIVSASLSQQVSLVEPPKPAVAAFVLPATSGSLTVPVSKFTATGFAGIAGYLVTESPVAPSANDPGWSASVPGNFTFSAPSGDGEMTAYAFVKDSLGKVSAAASAKVAIAREPVQVTLDSNLNFTYDGSAKNANATTTPVGHPATITYNGSSTAPTDAGSYTVVATVNENSYWGSASATLTIARAEIAVTLSTPGFTFDGTAKSATASTTPAGVKLSITYNGSDTAPTNAGSYPVLATVTDANYLGSATGTLVIDKAIPALAWSKPADVLYGAALSGAQLNAAAPVPGSFVYTPQAGELLLDPGSQSLAVTFTPSDAANYTAATAAVSLTVVPIGNMSGNATVTIADALMALQSAVGLYSPTAQQIRRGDVGPLVGGKPAPDGKVDIGDAVVILRKITELVNW